jgi:hypothetical protein
LLILDAAFKADHKNISFEKNTSKNTKNMNEIKKGNIPATHFVYDKLIFTHLNVDPNLKNPQKIKILKIKMCSESKSVHNI